LYVPDWTSLKKEPTPLLEQIRRVTSESPSKSSWTPIILTSSKLSCNLVATSCCNLVALFPVQYPIQNILNWTKAAWELEGWVKTKVRPLDVREGVIDEEGRFLLGLWLFDKVKKDVLVSVGVVTTEAECEILGVLVAVTDNVGVLLTDTGTTIVGDPTADVLRAGTEFDGVPLREGERFTVLLGELDKEFGMADLVGKAIFVKVLDWLGVGEPEASLGNRFEGLLVGVIDGLSVVVFKNPKKLFKPIQS